MSVCQDCSVDFHGLETAVCNKCTQADGQSDIDKASIRAKPQCRCCSVIFSQLQEVFCNRCCHDLASAETLPRAILDLPGAYDQISNFKTSDYTSEIWELAEGYKRTASDTRLGLPRTQNTSLRKTPSALRQAERLRALEKAVPGIGRGMTRVQQTKDKHNMAQKIKIIITMATSDHKNKLTTIPSLSLVHNAHEESQIFNALGDIISEVQELFAKQFPKAAKIVR
ncbi:hypothetical protein C8R43DRAFT_951913 [Mycena crocata]|nr:hypothetical protein C8R43DRAFT_951913 [Mycena crocata]